MTDQFWANIRYTMIAIGAGLVMKALGNLISADQAASLVTPIVDLIISALPLVGGYLWGNVVTKGTKMVPVATAARSDVPTVSSVTGTVQPATKPSGR